MEVMHEREDAGAAGRLAASQRGSQHQDEDVVDLTAEMRDVRIGGRPVSALWPPAQTPPASQFLPPAVHVQPLSGQYQPQPQLWGDQYQPPDSPPPPAAPQHQPHVRQLYQPHVSQLYQPPAEQRPSAGYQYQVPASQPQIVAYRATSHAQTPAYLSQFSQPQLTAGQYSAPFSQSPQPSAYQYLAQYSQPQLSASQPSAFQQPASFSQHQPSAGQPQLSAGQPLLPPGGQYLAPLSQLHQSPSVGQAAPLSGPTGQQPRRLSGGPHTPAGPNTRLTPVDTERLWHQKEACDRLRRELERHQRHYERLRADTGELTRRLETAPPPQVDERLRLAEENQRLKKECDIIRSDIERLRAAQQARRGSVNTSIGHSGQSHAHSGPEDEDEAGEGPQWECGSCTFLNHPAMSTCEQCEMPRLHVGTTAVPVPAVVAAAGGASPAGSHSGCYCHPGGRGHPPATAADRNCSWPETDAARRGRPTPQHQRLDTL